MKNKWILISHITAGCTSQLAVIGNEKPSVIFIFSDDLGYADLSIFKGNKSVNLNYNVL
jgi:hypothetical protein